MRKAIPFSLDRSWTLIGLCPTGSYIEDIEKSVLTLTPSSLLPASIRETQLRYRSNSLEAGKFTSTGLWDHFDSVVTANDGRVSNGLADLSYSPANVLDQSRNPESQKHDPSSLNGDRGDSNTPHTILKRSLNGYDIISVKTMLSNASLVFRLPEERDNLIAAFVKDFHEGSNIDNLSKQQRARAYTRLPELLKLFSLRLEVSARGQKERDTKDFIWQECE
jgi:hypothetical protein